MNLANLVEQNVRRDPDQLALRFETETFTYGQLAAASNRAANGFAGLGIEKVNRGVIIMTINDNRAEITRIVREFTFRYIQDKLLWLLGQIVPGADEVPAVRAALVALASGSPDALSYTMEPQEWLTMALYGAGAIDADAGEMQEICQGMAEWLFALPHHSNYDIPAVWVETEMGALWWQAAIRAQGDELITIAEAAELAGVTTQAMSQRVVRGKLKGYTNPLANERQGRQLVRCSDIVAAVAQPLTASEAVAAAQEEPGVWFPHATIARV